MLECLLGTSINRNGVDKNNINPEPLPKILINSKAIFLCSVLQNSEYSGSPPPPKICHAGCCISKVGFAEERNFAAFLILFLLKQPEKANLQIALGKRCRCVCVSDRSVHLKEVVILFKQPTTLSFRRNILYY